MIRIMETAAIAHQPIKAAAPVDHTRDEGTNGHACRAVRVSAQAPFRWSLEGQATLIA